MPQAITVRAADTEPLEITFGARAQTELVTADLGSAVLFLREEGGDANHVDGAALGSVSVASEQNGDGSWAVSGSGLFDPVDAAVGGGNALTSPGRYTGYVRATWSDGDVTRHPADSDLVVIVRRIFE